MALIETSYPVTGGWQLKDAVADFMTNVASTLTHWSVVDSFGTGGEYGGILRNTAADREFLFMLRGAGNDIYGLSAYGGPLALSISNVDYSWWAYNRRDRSGLTLAQNMVDGTSGSQLGIISVTGITTPFENGETVTVNTATNVTTGTLVHWDLTTGIFCLTGMTRSGGLVAPGSGWSNKTVTGSVSGATGVTRTSNYYPSTGHWFGPPSEMYLSITTGVAPTAGQTITMGGWAITVEAGSGTPYDPTTGLLQITNASGNMYRTAPVSWSGGTGEVKKMMPIWGLATGAAYATNLSPEFGWEDTATADSSHRYIVLEDEDRFALLIPKTTQGSTYAKLLVGAWGADPYGGTFDLMMMSSTIDHFHFSAQAPNGSTTGSVITKEILGSFSLNYGAGGFRSGLPMRSEHVVTDANGIAATFFASNIKGPNWRPVQPVEFRLVGANGFTKVNLDSQHLFGLGRGLADPAEGQSDYTVYEDAGGNQRWLQISRGCCIQISDSLVV